MAPKTLSVTLPNYNDSAHIATAVKALCEQSFPPTEISIVDDASTDNSVEIIKDLAAKYPCIRFQQNETNRGVNYSVNKAMSICTGDYIYLTSANDIILPGLFEKSMKALEKYPQAVISCTDQRVYNVKEGTEYDVRAEWLPEAGYLSADELVEVIRSGKPTFTWADTWIIRRDVIPNPIFVEELEWHSDWFLGMPLMFRHGCCYIPEPLAVTQWLGNESYSHAGFKNRELYTSVFKKLIQRLAAPEYEDITRRIIKARALDFIKPSIRTPRAVTEALADLDQRNSQCESLKRYIAQEYIRDNYSVKPLVDRYLKPVAHAVSESSDRARNLCDRVYARAFHEYDRLRGMVRGKH